MSLNKEAKINEVWYILPIELILYLYISYFYECIKSLMNKSS